MRATTWPASTVSPSRTMISTIFPSLFEEMSTVSPSIRPLTKSEFGSAFFSDRLHPVSSKGQTMARQIHFPFTAPSLPLLAVSLLSGSHGAGQIRASQTQRVHGSYPRVIGLVDAILRVDYFRIVGYALSESLTRQFHFFARQLHVSSAGFHFLE